jgi:hypothetical protein
VISARPRFRRPGPMGHRRPAVYSDRERGRLKPPDSRSGASGDRCRRRSSPAYADSKAPHSMLLDPGDSDQQKERRGDVRSPSSLGSGVFAQGDGLGQARMLGKMLVLRYTTRYCPIPRKGKGDLRSRGSGVRDPRRTGRGEGRPPVAGRRGQRPG